MAQSKSTRAFRTISEAADELELQAHVLRFWESKFSDIQPMKRRGGRRFYRPEDIEFLRGIKILLHREKHPIKDVQKLIRIRGAQSVMELGRSAEQASRPRAIKDTSLVPERIKPVIDKPVVVTPTPQAPPTQVAEQASPVDDGIVRRPGVVDLSDHRRAQQAKPAPISEPVQTPAPVSGQNPQKSDLDTSEKANLEDALARLKSLRSRWQEFK